MPGFTTNPILETQHVAWYQMIQLEITTIHVRTGESHQQNNNKFELQVHPSIPSGEEKKHIAPTQTNLPYVYLFLAVAIIGNDSY